jgi:hypothetical protein
MEWFLHPPRCLHCAFFQQPSQVWEFLVWTFKCVFKREDQQLGLLSSSTALVPHASHQQWQRTKGSSFKDIARTKMKARYLHHDLGTTSLYDWVIAILIWVDPRARLAPYSSHGQSLLWMTTWNSKEAHTKEDISMAFPPNTWSLSCGLVQVFRVYTLIGFSTITTRVHCDNEFRPCHWSIEKSIRVIKEGRVRAA